MNDERFVVLGLARPRAAWFSEISRWATSAAIPVEFVKCLTVEEARARLASGRRWSAFIVEGTVHGLDRDLLAEAREVGATPIVLADPRVSRDWIEIGAKAILPLELDQLSLIATLVEHASPIARVEPQFQEALGATPPPWQGRLVAVCGTGGSGSSVIAACVAHGAGSDVRHGGLVVLADLALHADQAAIHDAGDIMPGLPELIDAHRLGRPSPQEVQALTFNGGQERPYDLLLGLRRHRDWTALRSRSVESALAGLRSAYRVVVADIDADLEGEAETGSLDLEDRNLLARTTMANADLVLVVGRGDTVGIHALARLLREITAFGVEGNRILVTINFAPRSPRRRHEIEAALVTLTASDRTQKFDLVFISERRNFDEIIRTAAPWPSAVVNPLTKEVNKKLAEPAPRRVTEVPERIVPGSLGTFFDEESDVV